MADLGSLGILALVLLIAVIVLFIALFVFWVQMLIDAIKRTFPDGTQKVLWIFVILFFGLLGAIVYYLAVKKDSKR